MKITKKEHQERHVELHQYLDELFADAIQHGNLSTDSTILELASWSCKQTEKVDHFDKMQEED